MVRKSVLITGCSSGFGFLTALKFARNGWQTFAGIRDLKSQGSEDLWEIKKRENLPLDILLLDVTSPLSVKEAVQAAVNKSGRVDVLVNNAGFGFLGPVEEFSVDEIKQQYETNIFGSLRMIKAVVPIMRKMGSGLIINLGSVADRITFPLYGVYSSSKFALLALSTALRFELEPFGVKVVLVEPGTFLTKFHDKRKHPEILGQGRSNYRSLTERFFTRYQKAQESLRRSWLKSLKNPQKVADVIFRIAQVRKPRSSYVVGFDAHLFLFLKKVLPAVIWERLLHKVYGW